MQLWMYNLQTGEPKSWWCNLNPKAWDSGGQWHKSQSLKAHALGESEALMSMRRRRWMSQSTFTLPPPFCSIQALSNWMTHPHWWGHSSLLSLLIQMLISSGNTLTDTPKNNILPAIWECLSPINLTHKNIYHRASHNKVSNCNEQPQLVICWDRKSKHLVSLVMQTFTKPSRVGV